MIHWQGFAGTPDQPGEYWHDTIIQDLLARLRVDVNLLVTPGHFRDGEAVNAWLAKNGPAIVWILGDEEGDCPFWEVKAPVWRQFPNPHKPYWPDRILPLGYTPKTRETVQALGLPLEKKGWVFAGQNTNQRRKECVAALERLDPTRVHASDTFAAGVDHTEYMRLLWESEWAPCPAGNVRADSFRMWEALEAGAVPLLDATSPSGDRNVWPDTLGDHPFPMVASWHDVAETLEQPPPEAGVWYIKYKRDLVKRLEADWAEISGVEPWDPPRTRITTVITASPVPSNPGFDMLTETVESVRDRLPGNEIIIAFDGSRKPDSDYAEHIRRVAWYANQYWPETWVHYTGVWKHQAGTVKDVLADLGDKALLMLEHDTPLKGQIPWDELTAAIYHGDVNLVRFHYDTGIHPEHKYLMKGMIQSQGQNLVRTLQYSQRPHLTTTMFYRDLLSVIPDEARTYIEDCVYGSVANSPWDYNKLAVYAPDGDMQRSYHLDGRAGIPKEKFWF